MNAAARTLLAACALAMLAACGASPPPEPEADAADEAAAEALGRDTDATVFDDMVQTEDKARAVENLTLGRKGELDQAMDAATGDAPADTEEE